MTALLLVYLLLGIAIFASLVLFTVAVERFERQSVSPHT